MITKTDLEKLDSKVPKIRYGFAKELLKICSQNPEQLYEHFDYWVELMASNNNILKWTAIDIIGYLSAVDKENKIDNKIKDLIQFLHSGVLITCNHSIFALGLISQNKPEYKDKIIKELLAISQDEFATSECKNIAIGKVLETIKPFVADIKTDKYVREFIENATKSERNSTKKKAEQLLKKIEKQI
ncbi:hypothetical protein SDC9_188798 [bioreactor metagenome]|uniref:HEAT repeat domain-containing protein n=1 Tax=bioreactor metagenome TaxID=1076179 RepID=A0A645HRN3_9ZZZZ